MDHVQRLRTLHLFAGAGGGILADLLLGHVPVCAVEIDPYCQQVLLARQRDGLLPGFPVWDDVRTFDGHPWRGRVDVVAGGFPCQDISVAGAGAGIHGPRSGLWAEFARLLGEVRPRYAFIENTAALAVRGLHVVLADLAALGMDARWCCLGADDVGAPHHRKRLWILGHATGIRCHRPPAVSGSAPAGKNARGMCQSAGTGDVADAQCPERGQDDVACRAGGAELLSQWPEGATRAGAGGADVADACDPGRRRRDFAAEPWTQAPPGGPTLGDPDDEQRQEQRCDIAAGSAHADPGCPGGRQSEPRLGRVADGMAAGLGWSWPDEPAGVPRVARDIPDRVARLRALGNGQVPLCAAVAWRILTSEEAP